MDNESIDEMRDKVFSQYPFSLSEYEKGVLEILNSNSIPSVVSENRKKLEYLGNQCAIYAFLKSEYDKLKSIEEDGISDPVIKEYGMVTRSPSRIWELMGFVTLLEMDAISLFIGILSAQNDVERKMLGKHAYTIVYEARKNGLFDKVSNEMRNFPESLLSKMEYKELWCHVKNEFKRMSNYDVEKNIRNNIDAHKSDSFECQYNTFRSCNWTQTIMDLIILIQISDKLLKVLESIFVSYKQEFEVVADKLKSQKAQYDAILEQLRNFKG